MGNNAAQISVAARDDIVWVAGVEARPAKKQLANACLKLQKSLDENILRALQFVGFTRAVGEEEVAVLSSLFGGSGVNRVSLLKGLLRGSPLLNEAGHPRLRAGLLVGLYEVVEGEARSEGANGDVEAALYISGNQWSVSCTIRPETTRRPGLTPKLSFTGAAW